MSPGMTAHEMTRSSPRRIGRLSISFFLVVLLCSLAGVALAIGVEVIRARGEVAATVERNIDLVRQGYLPAIAASLYVLDRTQLALLLRGVINLETIAYCEVQEGQGGSQLNVARGNAAVAADKTLVFPLQYRTASGVELTLGRLIVFIDTSASRETIRRRAYGQIASFSVMLFGTSALVLLLFQRLVARHLYDMAAFTRELDIGNLEPVLALRRRGHRDELQQVVDAWNSLRERLRRGLHERDAAQRALADHRDRLEEIVAERSRELETAHEQLIVQERLAILGKLTATVSHELRNPLGTIGNALFSVREALPGAPDPRVERALDLAERNIARCVRIIAELLEFSVHRRGGGEETAVDDWLEGVIRRQEIPAAVTVELRLHGGVTLLLERERVENAVANVVSNAVQAMEECAEKRLTVETLVEDARLLVVFRDTGRGMSPEVAARAFEPLFSTRGFGVGLGLSLVRTALEEHEGGVDLVSTEGRGTTVTFWLPLVDRTGAG
jgi:signal transduction histidine kinase